MLTVALGLDEGTSGCPENLILHWWKALLAMLRA